MVVVVDAVVVEVVTVVVEVVTVVVDPSAVVVVVPVVVVSPAAVDVESHEAAQTLLQQLSPVSQRPICKHKL